MIAQLLRQQCYLVLVDNLETAENADALVAHLRNLLGVSRAIVTSRKPVRHDFVKAHTLKELTREDSLFFLRYELLSLRHLNNVRKKSKFQGGSTSTRICVAPTCT
jgi:hypothetical protein